MIFGHTATARAESGATAVSIGDGFLFPSHFRCWIETAELPGLELVLRVHVDALGDPSCRELGIRPAPDQVDPPAVTPETLRKAKLRSLLAIAMEAAMEKGEWRDGRLYLSPMSRDDVDDVHGRYVTRRHRAAAQDLESVAAIYREAVKAESRAPTKAVAERLHVSRSHAARLVMRARKAELLGPAIGTKAGEET